MSSRKISIWVWLYALAFAALTGADIASTLWAASSGIGQEFNAAVATESGSLHVQSLLLINTAFLAFTAGMMAWALRVRERIDPAYLARPEKALFNYLYLNPFARRNVPKSAFHYLALGPAVLMLKGFAACNNSLIAAKLPDIVTPMARLVAQLGGGMTVTYWTVIIILCHLFFFISLNLTARALRAEVGGGQAQAAAA